MVTIYTDGAAKGNPGPGGYAAILSYKGLTKELVGAYTHTTNNRMELLAVIIGLEALKNPPQRTILYSDSRYVVDAIQKGWLKNWFKQGFKKQKNKDLWYRFWHTYRLHHVQLKWVKGHAGNPMNERCDYLATTAATTGPWETDTGYLHTLQKPLL